MKIIVIGSGLSGISAAIRLQTLGHEVSIVEKRDRIGGRAYTYEQDGFKFDGGQKLITVPKLITELFENVGKTASHYVKLIKLNPFYNVRWNDETIFEFNENDDAFLEQIKEISPPDAKNYQKFSKELEEIYRFGVGLMNQSAYESKLKLISNAIKLRPDKSLNEFVSRHFTNEKLRQIFSFQSVFDGKNPFSESLLYAMTQKIERDHGVWYAVGGQNTLLSALCELFLDIGGEVFLQAEVGEISVNMDGEANGVKITTGEFIRAESVIVTSDLATSYLNLLPAQLRRKNTDKKVRSLNYSPSLFTIHFGTNRQYHNFAHQEFLLPNNFKALMDDIFVKKTLSDEFLLQVQRPTATDASFAPEGCDSWTIFSVVPHLSGNIDWRGQAKDYRNKIIKYLEDNYLPDLTKHIATEISLSPLYFRDSLNSYLGNAFGINPNLKQTVFSPNYQSDDVKNLFFVQAEGSLGLGLSNLISDGKNIANIFGKAK
jgi:phytoene desaturase